ncbi:putative glycosyltransferase [Arcticibacter svalbardensis MN12-7]|uniref:Putative glycosyltransferase n=1 Tax=Arcticibacter svalbardensis MN12-7 TaxID=1150600 RepID=R9GUJ1_9SPHI|nr:putative glycosyltransferase [Arcticibacter svalbardensis MN12-7]
MFKPIKKYLSNLGEVSKRIQHRHHLFWNDPNAEWIRNTPMRADDSMEKWQDVPYWQRKLSNKYNAREFAIKHGCKVADLYWRGSDVQQINFETLPLYYVIRPTVGHSSNLVFLMHNGLNLFDDKGYSPEDIRDILRSEVDKNPDLEFLIEEFLENEEGEHAILDDYKLLCFNGVIASCHAIKRFSPSKGEGNFYDEHWNKMETLHLKYPLVDGQKPPKCWDEIISQAKMLSKAYGIFVRIDFYATSKGAVFGEFTPTPGMGRHFSSYGKKLMIRYWDMYCKGLV